MDLREIIILVMVGIISIYLARRDPKSAAEILTDLLKREKRNDIKRDDEDDPRD